MSTSATRGQEWHIGQVHFARGKTSNWITDARIDGLNADQLGIVLRSNPAIAADTIDLTQIWQGELVYPALPLLWPPEGVTRPTKFDGGVPPIVASKHATTQAGRDDPKHAATQP